MSKSCLNACQQCSRRWGVILTESQRSRVCTHALLQPPYLFVFSSRCTARPWRAMKVMLVVQRWKCVTGGRLQGPAWNLQSPHRVQDRGPAQEQERRESKRPVETRCPSTRNFTQILFHSETRAATGRWAACKLQSGRLRCLLFKLQFRTLEFCLTSQLVLNYTKRLFSFVVITKHLMMSSWSRGFTDQNTKQQPCLCGNNLNTFCMLFTRTRRLNTHEKLLNWVLHHSSTRGHSFVSQLCELPASWG